MHQQLLPATDHAPDHAANYAPDHALDPAADHARCAAALGVEPYQSMVDCRWGSHRHPRTGDRKEPALRSGDVQSAVPSAEVSAGPAALDAAANGSTATSGKQWTRR